MTTNTSRPASGTETYKGRKIRFRTTRVEGFRCVRIWLNGKLLRTCGPGTTADQAIEQIHRDIDFVDLDPVVDGDRWSDYWYAPGTYRMCDKGLHPVALDGECRHFTCVCERENAAPNQPEQHQAESFPERFAATGRTLAVDADPFATFDDEADLINRGLVEAGRRAAQALRDELDATPILPDPPAAQSESEG